MEETLRRPEIIKRIDGKLEFLIKEKKIEDTRGISYNLEWNMQTSNILSSEYWKKVVSFYTEDELADLVSIPQSGNWNRFLYKEAQNRLNELATLAIEEVITT